MLADPVSSKREVLEPHGFVKLVDWMGDEVAIVNAARVSFAKESQGMDSS